MLQRAAGWCEAVQSLREITPEQTAERKVSAYGTHRYLGAHCWMRAERLPLEGAKRVVPWR